MSSKSPEWYRATYEDLSTGGAFLAADDLSVTGQDVVAARNASYTVYVQKVIFNIGTSAAQTIDVQDNAGTAVVLGRLIASQTGRQVVVDGGAEGIPLTVGKNLDLVASAAGYEGTYSIEAYQRPTVAIDSTAGASSQ